MFNFRFKNGSIAKTPGILGGFTFGPLFIPEGYDKPYNELTDFKTHRYDAVCRLIDAMYEKNII